VLPILAATAKALSINPLLVMLPATICASCAFVLPIDPVNAKPERLLRAEVLATLVGGEVVYRKPAGE